MLFGWSMSSQNFLVKGKVSNDVGPLPKVTLQIEGSSVSTQSDTSGKYVLELPQGSYVMEASLEGYGTQRIPLEVFQNTELNVIMFENITNLQEIQQENLITEVDFADEGNQDTMPEFLDSTKEIYFQRAAYDWSQVFYRPRGYDSKEASVLINGIPMAKIETARAQWSNWGGLNDVTRNQITRIAGTPSQYDFGGVLGSKYISIRPSEMRSGLRLSATSSNRSYSGRMMATYVPRWAGKGFTYALSASKRWTNNGVFLDGMLNNSYSISGILEYKPNYHTSVSFLNIYADNYRGKSAPLTQEAIALGGRRYNPNWGYQNGDIRNSKMKRIVEPLFILSYLYDKAGTMISANVGYQYGEVGDTRIQYAKSQNPDPTYYTNMPTYFYSFHQPGQPNHDPFALQKTKYQIEYFRNHPQLDWNRLYQANQNSGESLYVLNEDIIDTKTLSGNILVSSTINNYFDFQAGATYQNVATDNYQQINDLLGGNYFLNKSYYTNEWYSKTDEVLRKGDKYQYHYKALANKLNAFAQLHFKYKRAKVYVAGRYDFTQYQRDGQFHNTNIYIDTYGKSAKVHFNSFSTKAGLTYVFSGNHTAQVSLGYFQTPQTLNAVFTNIRSSNGIVPSELKPETQLHTEANYNLRWGIVQARLTGYATRFANVIDKNFFYTESYIADNPGGFLTETVSGIEKQHYGIEFGTEIEITPQLKTTLVASINDYRYTNNPTLFQSSDHLLISKPITAYMKNYKVSAGPEQAFSVGVEYRSKKYWWVGATGNLFRNNYVDVAPSLRTTNFYINPNDGKSFSNIDPQKVRNLLKQEDLGELFLVNLTGGKSWRVNGKYINLFVSINNLLNKQFKSSGFEQVRKGNYEAMLKDRANGYPVFGNKYFVGYGINYMVNLAVSL